MAGNQNNQYLEHYGVLGMKWGIRKDPQRAFSRSMQKLGALDERAQKKKYRADQKQAKADKAKLKEETAWTMSGQMRAHKRALKAQAEASKYKFKATKATRRGNQWVKKMNKYFDGVKINEFTPDQITLGKKYALALVEKEQMKK